MTRTALPHDSILGLRPRLEATTIADRVLLVSASGELDMHVAAELEAFLGVDTELDGRLDVAVDLMDVRHVDSSILLALLRGREAARRRGRRLVVACPPGAVRRVFEITSTDAVLDIHDGRGPALAALTSTPARPG